MLQLGEPCVSSELLLLALVADVTMQGVAAQAELARRRAELEECKRQNTHLQARLNWPQIMLHVWASHSCSR